MKKVTIGALLGAQLLAAAQPASAAELEFIGAQRTGAFGGLRLRMPLGGDRRERQLRAGLTLAPTLHDRLANGESRLRIGEGVEFGLRGPGPMRLSIGGRDLRRLGAREGGDDHRGGISTGAWIAGGIVLVTIAGVTVALLALEDAADSPS
jgi:hypothetical protein